MSHLVSHGYFLSSANIELIKLPESRSSLLQVNQRHGYDASSSVDKYCTSAHGDVSMSQPGNKTIKSECLSPSHLPPPTMTSKHLLTRKKNPSMSIFSLKFCATTPGHWACFSG